MGWTRTEPAEKQNDEEAFGYGTISLVDFANPVSSPAFLSLAVSGPSQVPDHSTAQYGAVATYQGGTTRDVSSPR